MTLPHRVLILFAWSTRQPLGYAYRLSNTVEHRLIIRVRCFTCKKTHHYRLEDLIQIFGDADVNALHRRMKCEKCGSARELDVEGTQSYGSELVGLKIRRLVAIKLLRVPVWREE